MKTIAHISIHASSTESVSAKYRENEPLLRGRSDRVRDRRLRDRAVPSRRRYESCLFSRFEGRLLVKEMDAVVVDHISVKVRDLAAARKFYGEALGAIGMSVNMKVPMAFGMGSKDEKIFWLERDKKAAGGGHYALRVGTRRLVDAFHRAAMRAGGKENGKPGLRPDYGPNYYAAFVKDREGNNIEVVCYEPARAIRRTTAQSPRGTSTRAAIPRRARATTAKARAPKSRALGRSPAGRKKAANRRPSPRGRG